MKNYNPDLPIDQQHIDDDEPLFGDACGHDACNIDGTDFRCMLCGTINDALVTKQELDYYESELN